MKTAYTALGVLFIILLVGAHIAFNRSEMGTLTLSSPAFADGDFIPEKYSCDGENVSPPLIVSGVPEGTESLVLLVHDPDVPPELRDEPFDHWVMYGIDPATTEIAEGAVVGSVGPNSRGDLAYTGPCPPPQYEPTEHRYFFKLYAISSTLNFVKAPTKDEVEAAIAGSIIEETTLMGRYDRAR